MTISQKAVVRVAKDSNQPKPGIKIHPAWLALMRHCQEIGYGEIERLKVQDGGRNKDTHTSSTW